MWLLTCADSCQVVIIKSILDLMEIHGENKTFSTEDEVKSGVLKKLPDLKTLREARGLTTGDIFLKTRINATILNAIENGEFDLLPAPVFTKKFIQIYAESIGIDAGIILAHYQRHLDKIQQVVPEEVKVVKAQIAFDRRPFKRYLLYAVPAVAIIAAVCAAFLHKKEILGIFKLPQSAPPAAMVAQKESMQTPSNTRLDLLIVATEDTWLNIAEDRNPPYQITLKTGDKLSRNAREFFVIDIGNAAGVNITFLGKSLGNLGRKGQVVHLRLPQR